MRIIRKKNWRKALIYIIVFTMCFTFVSIPTYAEGIDITQAETEIETASEIAEEFTVKETVSDNDSIVISEETTNAEKADGRAWDQVTTESVYEDENYKITFTLVSYWDAGYNANIKLENIGDETINNWYLAFEHSDEITNVWNTEIFSKEGYRYILKNLGWNQNIDKGDCIEF